MTSENHETKSKVLVVNSKKGLLEGLIRNLDNHEIFDIETAYSAEQAKNILKNSCFDVIVSDYELPNEDGLRFLEEIKTKSFKTPLILFSEKNRDELALKALKIGLWSYIYKENNPEVTYLKMAAAIQQAASNIKLLRILKTNKEQFRQMEKNAQIWIWETDTKDRYTQVSSSVENILGYKPEEVIGKKRCDFYFQKDRKKLENTNNTNSKNVPFHKLIVKNRHKNGSAVWSSSSGLPIFDSKGSVLGYRGVDADITEHAIAKEKLLVSEQKYRHLFEDNRDTIYVHDMKGKILSVNNAAEEYGFKKEQLIGKNLLNFVSKKYWAQLTLEIIKLSRGRRVEGEVEITTPIGNRIAEYRSTPIIYGNKVTSAVASLRDVTNKKKTEKELLKSQQKFQALFTANPEAAVFLDTNFVVIEVNSRFTSIFGYDPEEIKGKSIVDLIVPKEVEKESAELRKRMIQSHVETITRRKTKDGRLLPLFMSGRPIKVNNDVIGVVIVYKDMSDVIIAQEELSRALDRAELLNEKLSVVVGFIRHDIRNKLMGISGNVYLAEKYFEDKDRVKASLNNIKTATNNILSSLNFAKDFEMLGNQELTYTDVGKAFDQAITAFGDLRKVNIINECKGLTVYADEMLTTVFHNLIENSLKYGKTLTEIKIHAETKKEVTIIRYQDNGTGIDREIKEKLFVKGVGKGTGYGLYLIKRTCEIYGWTIDETGQPGEGVCFELRVPNKNET